MARFIGGLIIGLICALAGAYLAWLRGNGGRKKVRELADAQPKIAQLEQELADAQPKIAQLEQELADAQPKIAQLEQELADAQRKIAQPERELADSQPKIAQLEQELADAQRKIARPERELADAQPKIVQLEQELADAQPKIAQLEQELADAQPKIAQLEQELADAQPKIAQLEQELADARVRIAQLEQEKGKWQVWERFTPRIAVGGVPPGNQFITVSDSVEFRVAQMDYLTGKGVEVANQSVDRTGRAVQIPIDESKVTEVQEQGSAPENGSFPMSFRIHIEIDGVRRPFLLPVTAAVNSASKLVPLPLGIQLPEK